MPINNLTKKHIFITFFCLLALITLVIASNIFSKHFRISGDGSEIHRFDLLVKKVLNDSQLCHTALKNQQTTYAPKSAPIEMNLPDYELTKVGSQIAPGIMIEELQSSILNFPDETQYPEFGTIDGEKLSTRLLEIHLILSTPTLNSNQQPLKYEFIYQLPVLVNSKAIIKFCTYEILTEDQNNYEQLCNEDSEDSGHLCGKMKSELGSEKNVRVRYLDSSEFKFSNIQKFGEIFSELASERKFSCPYGFHTVPTENCIYYWDVLSAQLTGQIRQGCYFNCVADE